MSFIGRKCTYGGESFIYGGLVNSLMIKNNLCERCDIVITTSSLYVDKFQLLLNSNKRFAKLVLLSELVTNSGSYVDLSRQELDYAIDKFNVDQLRFGYGMDHNVVHISRCKITNYHFHIFKVDSNYVKRTIENGTFGTMRYATKKYNQTFYKCHHYFHSNELTARSVFSFNEDMIAMEYSRNDTGLPTFELNDRLEIYIPSVILNSGNCRLWS
jgi:hypothetical protein